jgi:hypothetical protein
LTQEAPGFSILSLAINRSTGLPNALLEAIADQTRFHQELPGVPLLSQSERAQQGVLLTIKSDRADLPDAEYFRRVSECVEKKSGSDLWEIRQGSSFVAGVCSRSVYPGARKWLAQLPDGSLHEIECEGLRKTNCSTTFGFQGFEINIAFHQSVLDQWKELIEFGRTFLESKERSIGKYFKSSRKMNDRL